MHFVRVRARFCKSFAAWRFGADLASMRCMSNKKKAKRPERKPAAPPAPAAKRAQDGEELSDDELESVAGGAVDVFAKIGDIKGESMDTAHKGEIEIESFSWGVSPTRKK